MYVCVCIQIFCVCRYLIIEDDHDKHTKQHRLHQQDNVVSTVKRENHNKRNDLTSLLTERQLQREKLNIKGINR